MSFPGSPAISDIVATTIESRTGKIADSVSKNNAILMKLKQGGRIQTFSGGSIITHELSFAANGNAGFYSGYDLLPVAGQDVISWASYDIKQAACPVVISGLEQLQNNGKEAIIDLMDGRLQVAEDSMANLISMGLYSDGTGSGGKTITGLEAAVPPGTSTARIATGTYGGIDRSAWAFWQPFYVKDATQSTTTLPPAMNALYANLVRGADRPDLIVCDNLFWEAYVATLQAQQRFMQAETGELGFANLLYMNVPVVLDGGIGGFAAPSTAYFLNTKYLKYRPHADRQFVPLSPNKRYAINQDAEVQIIGWAGNLTCGGQLFQGRLGAT